MIQLNQIQSTEWGFDINSLGNVVQGLNDIKQCIYIILTTQPGTDPLRPDFGCGVYDWIDKPVNRAIPNMVKAINDALNKYEKRIEKIKVSSVLDGAMITFKISWKLKNSVQTGQIDVNYGLTNT